MDKRYFGNERLNSLEKYSIGYEKEKGYIRLSPEGFFLILIYLTSEDKIIKRSILLIID